VKAIFAATLQEFLNIMDTLSFQEQICAVLGAQVFVPEI
jgi:hypothetical protein